MWPCHEIPGTTKPITMFSAITMKICVASRPTRRITINTAANKPKIAPDAPRSEEHTSELQSRGHLGWRPLLAKKQREHTTYRAQNCHTLARYEAVCSCPSSPFASVLPPPVPPPSPYPTLFRSRDCRHHPADYAVQRDHDEDLRGLTADPAHHDQYGGK